MKRKTFLAALLLSLGLLVAPVINSFDYTANDNYVAVVATPEAKADFLAKFNEIRTNQHNNGRSVCDTTKEEYEELVTYYYDLSKQEKAEVNAINDPYDEDYTIGDVMKEIVRN